MPVWNMADVVGGRRRIALLAGAFFLAATAPLATVPPAAAATATSNCATTATKFRTSNANAGSTSTNFANVPQSTIKFVQGGGAPGCVIVTFTSVITTASTWMHVKPTLDGKDPVDASTGLWRVASQESRTAVFVFTNVAPGKHKIVMKFRSNDGGNVTVYDRIATLAYRK